MTRKKCVNVQFRAGAALDPGVVIESNHSLNVATCYSSSWRRFT